MQLQHLHERDPLPEGRTVTLAWKDVECPRCLALPGESCVSKSGRKTYAHAVRHQRAAEDLRARVIQASETLRPPTYPAAMTTVHLPGDAP